MPERLARQRIEAERVAVGRDDQAIAVEQQAHVTRAQLVVGPDDRARVAVEGERIAIESEEDELVDSTWGFIPSSASLLPPRLARRDGLRGTVFLGRGLEVWVLDTVRGSAAVPAHCERVLVPLVAFLTFPHGGLPVSRTLRR